MQSSNVFSPFRGATGKPAGHRRGSTATTGFQKSNVLKAEPGYLTDLMVYNKAASTTYYILIFDATSLPADSTVPDIAPIPIAAKTCLKLDSFVTGLPFATGIVVAISSTDSTLTIASTSDAFFTAVAL